MKAIATFSTNTPGPWGVDTDITGKRWAVINRETGQTKLIGQVWHPRSHSKVNYFDRAIAEADRRNRALLTPTTEETKP